MQPVMGNPSFLVGSNVVNFFMFLSFFIWFILFLLTFLLRVIPSSLVQQRRGWRVRVVFFVGGGSVFLCLFTALPSIPCCVRRFADLLFFFLFFYLFIFCYSPSCAFWPITYIRKVYGTVITWTIRYIPPSDIFVHVCCRRLLHSLYVLLGRQRCSPSVNFYLWASTHWPVPYWEMPIQFAVSLPITCSIYVCVCVCVYRSIWFWGILKLCYRSTACLQPRQPRRVHRLTLATGPGKNRRCHHTTAPTFSVWPHSERCIE